MNPNATFQVEPKEKRTSNARQIRLTKERGCEQKASTIANRPTTEWKSLYLTKGGFHEDKWCIFASPKCYPATKRALRVNMILINQKVERRVSEVMDGGGDRLRKEEGQTRSPRRKRQVGRWYEKVNWY